VSYGHDPRWPPPGPGPGPGPDPWPDPGWPGAEPDRGPRRRSGAAAGGHTDAGQASQSHAGHAHAGHSHGLGGEDGWSELTAAPIRRALVAVVVAVAVAALAGLALWWPRGELVLDRTAVDFGERADATVTSAVTGTCSYDPETRCKAIGFDITSGDEEGDTGSIEQSLGTETPAASLDEGDEIVVVDGGSDLPPDARYQFADIQRGSSLWVLALVFAVAVVALGRLRGLMALAGIVISVGVLLVFVFPALLHGSSPLGVALTASVIIAFATLYLAHGVSDRTTVALVGTLASLGLTAALAIVFAGAASLSGLASEESIQLMAFAPELDFRGLLLAAVVIGTLGVLDDVTVTQVSAVYELHRSDPERTARELYRSGIRIGRDHIASTVNTLILAYSAAALPLLLLFTQSGLGLGDVLASETVAVEIVQTLVGSIGLVASVPLTTALACWVVTRSAPTDEPFEPYEPYDRDPEPRLRSSDRYVRPRERNVGGGRSAS
jgi:uncharacterized membrane protein